MHHAAERRLLQVLIAVLGLVPVLGGLAGVMAGPDIAGDAADIGISTDSHFRYLSGLLLGIGLAFWSTVPQIENRTQRVRLLTVIVFIGGIARLYALATDGLPSWPMTGALLMELVVTPLLCLWQGRIAKLCRSREPGG